MLEKVTIAAYFVVNTGILSISTNLFIDAQDQESQSSNKQLEENKVENSKTRSNFNAESTNSPSVVSYKYDALGRLVCVNDDTAGNRFYAYDEAGNRTSVSLNSGACN